MTDTARVRALNDEFRATLKGGRVMLTRGVTNRPDIVDVLAHIQRYDAFTSDNDPYQEHDFGALEAGRDTIYFKLDYYSKDLTSGSPDPADPEVTERVLTVMLAEEY